MEVGRSFGQVRRRLSAPAALGPKADPHHLRVLTYNTHHGANRAEILDLTAIAATVEGCEPDVVALQEVDRCWGDRSATVDQPSWYAHRLTMELHFAPQLIRQPADPTAASAAYGLVLLSRLPMTETDHRLYAGTRAEARGLAAALISVPTGAAQTRTVRVVNTHLAVRQPRDRKRQVAELVSYADSTGDLPTVLAGDFNALARARALRALRGTYRDAWEVGRGSPSTVRGRRIDYIWVSQHFRPVQTVVVRSAASDHFALVSDLAWS